MPTLIPFVIIGLAGGVAAGFFGQSWQVHECSASP